MAPEPAAPLVRLEGVSKNYRSATGDTRVLRAANLGLARGTTTSLTGVSGSGKSTLIALLAGLLLPDSGSVAFDGQNIAALDEASRARLRAKRIGVVVQRDNLIPFLTARENVELAVSLADGDRPAARARDVLARLGLSHRLDHRPLRLSGGEIQRASLAVAMVNEPELLLADEVTGELDSESAEQVMTAIFEASSERGLTLLFVTHSAELAAQAQTRLRLAEGHVRPQ